MFHKDTIQDDNLQYILIEKRVRSTLEVQKHRLQILLTSANQYIPKLLATFETEDYFYLIQNFIPGGDIFYHMTKKRDFTNDESFTSDFEMLLRSFIICVELSIRPHSILCCSTLRGSSLLALNVSHFSKPQTRKYHALSAGWHQTDRLFHLKGFLNFSLQ